MKNKIAYLILAAGAALRIVGLVVSPFWYDESFSVYLARYPAQMVRLEYIDFNPPLWQLLVTPSIKIFGENELGLRFPSLLASLAALWLAWKLAERFILPRWPDQRFIAPAIAAMIALLPYHFWLAQDGRCYALMSLIYLAALWMALDRRWLGFCACLGLLLYSHMVGLFYAPAAVLGALILHRDRWKKIFLCSVVAIISFLPWVPAYLIRRDAHWVGSLTVDGLLNSLYFSSFAAVFSGGYFALFVGLLVAGSILVGLVVALIRIREKDHAALTVWAVGPLVMMVLLAIVKNVIFYRILSAMFLPICLWIPASFTPVKESRWKIGRDVAYAWWVTAIIAGLVAWSPALKGAELRSMTTMINERWQPGDVVYHATATSWLPMSLYLDHPGFLLDEELPDGMLQTKIQAAFAIPRQALEEIPYSRVWIVWARDVLVTDQANQRMAGYIQGAELVGKINYWQAADIEIYLREK